MSDANTPSMDDVFKESLAAARPKTAEEVFSTVQGLKNLTFTRAAALSTIRRTTTEELAEAAVAAVYDW